MHFMQRLLTGTAGATLLAASLSAPVHKTAIDRYDSVAYAKEQWSRDFRPNLALVAKCNKKAGTMKLTAFDLTFTIPRKLMKVPSQFTKIVYPKQCYSYFAVSDIMPRKDSSFAAAVADGKSYLVKWAGGSAPSQHGTHWMWLTNHYTALVQTTKDSKAHKVKKPGKNRKVNLPHLPSS